MASKSHSPRSKKNLHVGPPEVIQWLDVTRDSPVELGRKFGYIVGWHEALADAETKHKDALNKSASKSVLKKAESRVTNCRAWLSFSIGTLDNHVRHALARCEPESEDGKLLREKGKQRKRYGKDKPVRFRKPSAKAEKKIRFYASILEEFKLAKAAAAGHSGSNEALEGLIKHSQSVIQSFANTSNREREDAEQAAIMSLLKSAKAYSPTHKNMARFNTYAWWKARRAVEVRSQKDCKPGTTLVPDENNPKEKKIVTVASINAAPKGKDDARDAFHPPVEEPDEGRRMDVRKAIQNLSEIEQAVAVGVLMEEKSIRQVSRETGFSARRLRTALERAQEKLRRTLSGHSDIGRPTAQAVEADEDVDSDKS